MYLPAQFQSKDRAIAMALMRAEPFATLIAVDDEGLPFAAPLPLLIDIVSDGEATAQPPEEEGAGPALRLWGHCARGNPLWRYLQARPHALATFQGPHAYLSPSVYPDLARVPSWNYVAVHCKVQAQLVQEPEAKDALLKRLIGAHEPAYAQQWRDLGEDYQRRMLAGMVGFELRITQLQCALKLNQHRPESHAALYARYRNGNADEQALAQWMQRLGLTGTKGDHVS